MRRGVWSAVLTALATACGVSDKEVAADFYRDHPADAQIIDILRGEGDADHSYVHIRYAKRGETAVYEEVRLYRSTSSGWRFHKVVGDGSSR